MKILSMTATFGKLRRQTLPLEPDFNIIHAPNEWGKSTWCAFLMAMLYGIDTGSRTKTGFLADKEHYAPWTGEPMSGSMDILWNGREITLQRQNKGRIPLGEVKAFETHTGIAVPELEIAAPGQVLLGVERSVFARAGFLKLSEMPVTEDESLRRRLNELVTTGDESGASDDLAQKLKDLKNACRFNKKGRLPELENQRSELDGKLQQLQTLKAQISNVSAQQEQLQKQTALLENHKQALEYQSQLQYAQKLAAAQISRDAAAQSLQLAQDICRELPPQDTLLQNIAAAQQLRETRDTLHTKAQLLPPLPAEPVASDVFRGKDPNTVAADASLDRKVLQQLHNDLKKPVPYIIGGGLLVIGILLLLLLSPVAGALVMLAGIFAIFAGIGKQKKLKKQIAELCDRYRGISPDRWEAAAAEYAAVQLDYSAKINARQQELADINRQLADNTAAVDSLTGGESLARFEEQCRQSLSAYHRLQEQQKKLQQAEDVLLALSGAGKQVAPPQFEDTLHISLPETERLLSEGAVQKQLLHQRLGQFQGQMDTLGQEEHLLTQRTQLQSRIEKLELYYRALTRAQEALVQATQELQRRFAPQIAKRAQELFGRMTGGRYQHVTMGQDFSLETATAEEINTHSTLWRSDGTVDQLYLALRMAVAEALTPDAPLVLDDALVRFDDDRLRTALEILRETAGQKQVILFTCQSREQQLTQEETQ